MIYCIFLIFISIILENLSNIYLSSFNYFVPLFTLLSLIFIYPCFKKEKYKYYIFSSMTGFIYDLLFTNFIILHPLIFILIVLLSKKVLNKTNNIFYYLLLYFVIIIIYTLFIDVITTNNNLLYFYNNIKTILIINTIIYLIYYLSFIGIKCLIKNKHKNHSYL